MFKKGIPVWIDGKENTMNIQARFSAKFEYAENVVLRICGATYYKVFVNGNFVHYGPALAACGYARVDVVCLTDLRAENIIEIEAAGYNCFSFDTVKQTSYICAEVISGDMCVAATGYDFDCHRVRSRVRKAMRYSYQRQFSEVWDLTKCDSEEKIKPLDLNIKYLNRRASMPDMEKEKAESVYAKGLYGICDRGLPTPDLQGAVFNICEHINGYDFAELESNPISEFLKLDYKIVANKSEFPCRIRKGEYAVFECGRNTCGLINLKYKAKPGTRIVIAFDEKLIDGRFCAEEWNSINLIDVRTGEESEFTNFEVYGFKYFAVFAIEGDMELKSAEVVKMRNPIKNPPQLNCDDDEINAIYDAACETLACNSLGIFTDCPTRERAGWLCDSYYTAQALYELTHDTSVEDDFVENFLLAECDELPEGMLPQCYPADHPRGDYIPQWGMWFFVQLEQYKERNKCIKISDYKDFAYGFLGYFKAYENEFGLLENLGGWNFVEWSKANEWTDGVNFPTNMLYAKVMETVGKWYGDGKLIEKAAQLRRTVTEMSYDGEFFRDQAVRRDGKLVCAEHISEVCQYYAFMFETVTAETFPDLYKTMVNDFLPDGGKWERIEKVDAFMGMYMRMELLCKWGNYEQLVREIKSFFSGMAKTTGTLWEYKETIDNSMNHGFASYLAVLLLRVYGRR